MHRGYPADARLRRLASSLVAALTSVNGRSTSTPNLDVSPVAPYPAASRAQIWLLTRGIAVLTSASVSRCRLTSPDAATRAVACGEMSAIGLEIPRDTRVVLSVVEPL